MWQSWGQPQPCARARHASLPGTPAEEATDSGQSSTGCYVYPLGDAKDARWFPWQPLSSLLKASRTATSWCGPSSALQSAWGRAMAGASQPPWGPLHPAALLARRLAAPQKEELADPGSTCRDGQSCSCGSGSVGRRPGGMRTGKWTMVATLSLPVTLTALPSHPMTGL